MRRNLPLTAVTQPRAVIFFVTVVDAEEQNQDIAIFGSAYT
ncbi:hypothetical protein ACXPVS_24810 [Pseudomonas sp. Ma2-10]